MEALGESVVKSGSARDENNGSLYPPSVIQTQSPLFPSGSQFQSPAIAALFMTSFQQRKIAISRQTRTFFDW